MAPEEFSSFSYWSNPVDSVSDVDYEKFKPPVEIKRKPSKDIKGKTPPPADVKYANGKSDTVAKK